jgi:hypothetical protein
MHMRSMPQTNAESLKTGMANLIPSIGFILDAELHVRRSPTRLHVEQVHTAHGMPRRPHSASIEPACLKLGINDGDGI